MGLKINLDNRTEFVPNLIATSKVQLDCQDPPATAPGSVQGVDLTAQETPPLRHLLYESRKTVRHVRNRFPIRADQHAASGQSLTPGQVLRCDPDERRRRAPSL